MKRICLTAIAAFFLGVQGLCFGTDHKWEWSPIEPADRSSSADLQPEGKVYWADSKKGIFRSNLDGSNLESIHIPDWRRPEAIRPSTMALDMSRGKVYWMDSEGPDPFVSESWVDWSDGNLRRADLDGSNVEEVDFSAQNFVLDVTRNEMYFADLYPGYDHPPLGGIGRINLDGRTEDNYYIDLHQIDLTDVALDLEGGKIYWTNAFDDTIYRADLEITTAEPLITDLYYPSEIALDLIERKVYWVEWNRDGDGWIIRRANIDNPQIADLLAIAEDLPPYWWLNSPTELTIDFLGRKIYWRNQEEFIHRANLDGSQVEKLGRATGYAIDVEGGWIAWTDDGGRIHWADVGRADLGSHMDSFFISRVGKPYDIALDPSGGKLYWTNLSGAIHGSNLDGSNAQILVADLEEPKAIALLHGRKIYWADPGTEKIQAANLDGSQVEDIVIGKEVLDVAFDEAGSKLYWIEMPTAVPTKEPTLWRSDLDGSNHESLNDSEESGRPTSIALDVDGGNLYWTRERSIWRSDLDGSNVRELISEDEMQNLDGTGFSGGHHAIALDLLGGKIYWASYESSLSTSHGTIRVWELTFRCNLDGSQIEVIGEHGRGADNMVVHHTTRTAVSMPNAVSVPATSSLQQNVPNPFNSITRIPYHVASAGRVQLDIFNVLGQGVRTLVDQPQAAGSYQVQWGGRDQQGASLSSGIYMVRLSYPGGMQTRRMLYLK